MELMLTNIERLIQIVRESKIEPKQFGALLESGLLEDLLQTADPTCVNREFFRNVLADDFVVACHVHELEVDFNMPLDALVAQGRYDIPSRLLEDVSGESKDEGRRILEVRVVHFGRKMSEDEVLVALSKRQLKPACLWVQCAVGAHHGELQRDFPIVALGTSHESIQRGETYPILDEVGGDRTLRFGAPPVGEKWSASMRFLAVPV